MANQLSFYCRKPVRKILSVLIVVFLPGWSFSQDTLSIVKLHTASPHVHLLDTAFFMPQLNRSRRIWIYLPEGYNATAKKYPVLYMQDGQNIFDSYYSGKGEWNVDECLDSLIKNGKPAAIVIGIDSGLQRVTEYNPYNNETFGEGEGDKYTDFIISTLKPFIDCHYNTLPSKENTIIAGSSMGGLITYYAMLRHPDVFGKAGIFSPAFWAAPAIKGLTDSLAQRLNGKLFFYVGGLEGENYLDDCRDIAEKVGARSGTMIYYINDPVGNHGWQAWKKWFAEFYNWIMADGFNNVIKIETPTPVP